MILECVRDEAHLDALWPAWDELWRSAPDASPFQSPAWLRAWWAEFGTGAPHIALLRDGNTVRAVLPLYRLDGKMLPLGAGLTDYVDLLLAPDAPADAADALLAAALEEAPVPRCDLADLPEQATLRRAPTPPGWDRETWPGPPCPVLPLRPEPAIPKSMRRDIRQAAHRAERAGGYAVQQATEATLERALAALVGFHAARWQSRGEAGVLSDPHARRFLQEVAPALLQAGVLRLQTLSIDGQAAAAILALARGRQWMFYLSGFDPAQSFCSPATLLIAHMLAQAADEGCDEAHFLRGGERYKYAWGARDRYNQGVGFRRP